jgi:hypothetical protein
MSRLTSVYRGIRRERMATADVVKTALERNWSMVDTALEGLDEATMAQQPSRQCNSIA